LFLITARAGSKRIPYKNLARLGGISLVGFKAISAKRARHCARVIISTDSVAIQDEARSYGVDVPFLRPSELASDTATSESVIAHAMEWIEANDCGSYEAVMIMEPAAPFGRAIDYDGAVDLMIARDANLVVGVRPVPVNSVYVGPLDDTGRMTAIIDKMNAWQAQGRPPLAAEYTMNAALYLVRWDYFKRTGRLYGDRDRSYGYVMDPHYSIEIDHPIDLHEAEFMVEHGYVDMANWR
jgi:N-acylneuraminate cytidylyltransferase/CMP-N,N'-diacetyllegionaminic acid synthase